jgi:hypothetical protein
MKGVLIELHLSSSIDCALFRLSNILYCDSCNFIVFVNLGTTTSHCPRHVSLLHLKTGGSGTSSSNVSESSKTSWQIPLDLVDLLFELLLTEEAIIGYEESTMLNTRAVV